MEKVDFVLVGAEGVVESGGIINKVQNTPSLRPYYTWDMLRIFLPDLFKITLLYVRNCVASCSKNTWLLLRTSTVVAALHP
jgi:hypothetical protein